MPSDPAHRPPPELHPFIAGLLTVIHACHADMIALVQGVDVEGLKWMPTPSSPHLSGLVLHVLEVEDHLARLLDGESVESQGSLGSSNDLVMRDRHLVARIADTDARLKRSLESMTTDRLASRCPGDERTLAETLVEDLAHSGLHLGHMQLTRQLMVRVVPMQFPEYTHWA